MRTLRIAFAAAFLCMSVGDASAQQARSADAPVVHVAVFPLTGFVVGEDGRELAEAFRSMIITELAASGRLRIVERQAVDSLLQAQAISVSGMVSDAQAIQVGSLLGAHYAVSGGITVDRTNARLDLRLIDIETGEVVPPPFKDMVRKDDLLSLVDRVAAEFTGKAQVRARAADVRIPVAAAVAYSRGLDFEKRGMKQEAARMFRLTLELFPQHPHAGAALQRVN